MAVKQISVFLENKPGKLAEFTKVLSANNINLRALSLAEAEDFGIARMIVDDVFEASTVLKDAGYVAALKDVLAVGLSDKPGALAEVLSILGDSGINLEYMYAFTTSKPGRADMIFRVADNRKAQEVLTAAGITPLTADDIAGQ